MVEIGRIDIYKEVSLLSSHKAYPWERHFETVLRVMGYLKLNHNSQIAMDTNYPPTNYDNFELQDCTAFYGDVQEAIPINTPALWVKAVVILIMVDSYHVRYVADRHYLTGYMIYV